MQIRSAQWSQKEKPAAYNVFSTAATDDSCSQQSNSTVLQAYAAVCLSQQLQPLPSSGGYLLDTGTGSLGETISLDTATSPEAASPSCLDQVWNIVSKNLHPQLGNALCAGSPQLCAGSWDLLLGMGKARPGVPCTAELEMLWPLQTNSLRTLLWSRAAPASCACWLHPWIASQQSKPRKDWSCRKPYQKWTHCMVRWIP